MDYIFIFSMIKAIRTSSRGYVIQDPCNVFGDTCVHSGRRRAAAVLRAERDDADQEVSRRHSVLTLHLHQRSAAVAAARILAQDTPRAHLLVAQSRVDFEILFTPVYLENRQLDRLQNYAGLWIICEKIICKYYQVQDKSKFKIKAKS